jgi:hypothetical protein
MRTCNSSLVMKVHTIVRSIHSENEFVSSSLVMLRAENKTRKSFAWVAMSQRDEFVQVSPPSTSPTLQQTCYDACS